MRTAIVFPGQGTQRPGMGAPWRGHPAWSIVEQAEATTGEPLGHLLCEADAETLARTREAQLAILLTSLLAWEAVRDRVGGPVAFAGHSLGQVTALIASGVLDLRTGIEFAAVRAAATQRAADRRPGGMAALLGGDLGQAEASCHATEGCWIANDNAPGQVVIAGTPEGVDAGSEAATNAGVRRITPLNVGGAFHTPLMDDAVRELEEHLTGCSFADPAVPIVANDDAAPVTSGEEWRARSAPHVARRVRWREVQLTLAELGVERFVEVGAGTMLGALARRTVPEVHLASVATPDDLAGITP